MDRLDAIHQLVSAALRDAPALSQEQAAELLLDLGVSPEELDEVLG